MIEFDYNKSSNKLVIKTENSSLFTDIREKFSIENKNAAFIQRKFGRRVRIPQRKYCITPTGSCDLGLFFEIRRYLIESQVTDIKISESLVKRLKLSISTDVFTEFSPSLRDYQIEVLQKALKNGWGTCVLGTGAGKTLTTAALIENFFRNCKNTNTFRCLVLVPDLSLVSQTNSEFNNYGVTFKQTVWTGNNRPDLTSNVIICNSQILQQQFEINDWVKYVDLLVVDECHKVKPDNKISKIINQIKTPHKFGFTGTLPEDFIERWFIIGRLGPVLYEKTSFDLRLEQYLANVEVKILEISYPGVKIPKITDNNYHNELDFLYSFNRRNELIGKISNKLQNNTLILVNHIRHGESLLQCLTDICKDKQVYFIRGDVEVEERDKIKSIMENTSNVICIAISAIFSTGVNIKNLHNILFVSGGKSFIRTVQSIGRGLRLHESKNKLVIIDLCDDFHYSKHHSEKRIDIYKKEKIQYTIKNVTIH